MTDYKIARVEIDGMVTRSIALLNHPTYCFLGNNGPTRFAYSGKIIKCPLDLKCKYVGEPLTEQDLKERRLVLESASCEITQLNDKKERTIKDQKRIAQLTKQYPCLEDELNNIYTIIDDLGIDSPRDHKQPKTRIPLGYAEQILSSREEQQERNKVMWG